MTTSTAKRLRLLVRLGLSALLVLPATSAPAAELDAKAEAKARFAAGESHYNLNELSEALQEFKEAYRLYPDPVFLYNLGQCERQLNHYEEASRFYRSFLRKMPKAPNRAEVQRKIDEMEAAVKTRPAAAPHEELPARTDAPTTKSETPPPVPVEQPGAASAGVIDSPEQATRPVEAAASVGPAPLSASPANVPAAPAVADLGETTKPKTAAPAVYKTWWFWTVAGAAVAGTVAAILLYKSSGSSGPPDTVLGGQRVY